MQAIMRDMVVVLPGIMGSTLAKKDGSLVWAPSAGAVLRAIRTFGGCIKDLRLPDGIGDGHPGDGVEPVDLMPDLHFLPGVWSANIGYGALLAWLRTRFHLIDQREAPHDDPDACSNFLPIPYDWRLSNQFNGKRLKGIVEPALESGVGRAASSATPRSSSSVIRWVASSPAGISTRRAARRSPAS